MTFKRFSFTIFFTCINVALLAQPARKVALLNMNSYNLEANNSRMQATVNMLTLTGIPFDTTSSIDTAIKYPVIVTASRITDTALNALQRAQFINYVSAGGVIITSSLRDTALFNLFGINASNSDNTQVYINWDTTGSNAPYFTLVDDALEVQVSIGDTDEVNFYSRQWTLSTGQSLGNYENGTCAVAMNNFGTGKTYLFGPDFRDIVLRNQLNMDLEAQRKYSNGFEPSTDVFVFVMRNIIRNHIPNTIYKYTSPGNTASVLLITHDIDSKTSIDTMHFFSHWEASVGICAQYNITTRYMADTWMSNFYTGAQPIIDSLLSFGHILASHSVGHFPDYAKDTIFHYGAPGNTQASYTPGYFSGHTTGGTVLGELEVSRDILIADYGVPVRSFRAGHLCFPDSLGIGLESMGYEFNSTQSANDVLTGFPYYVYDRKSFSGSPSGVLEIPMLISDVFKDDPIVDTNHLLKVNIWIQDIARYSANSAPVTLLIHPNRRFKLDSEQRLVDSLPYNMIPYPFQQYGEYWRKRDSLLFHTDLSNDTLYVHMDNNELDMRQSFIIDDAGLDTVRFFDYNGAELTFQHQVYNATQQLYYRQQLVTPVKETPKPEFSFYVFPNPTTGIITVLGDKIEPGSVLTVHDITGKLVYTTVMQNGYKQVDLSAYVASDGMYFVKVTGKGFSITRKIVFTLR